MKNIMITVIVMILYATSIADITKIDAVSKGSLDWDVDIHSNGVCKESVLLSKGVIIDVVFEEFQNGNGSMSIDGQIFFIFDNHGDGASYNNGLLDVQFIDLDDDGFLDLICSGVVEFTGEIDQEVYEKESVVFIYIYNQMQKKYALKYKKASFDLEAAGDSSNQWWTRFYSMDKYEKFRKLDEKKDNEN